MKNRDFEDLTQRQVPKTIKPVLNNSLFVFNQIYTLLLSNPASSNAEKVSADNTSAHCIADKITIRYSFLISFVREAGKKERVKVK